MYNQIYTKEANFWLVRILNFPKPIEEKEKRKLDDYLIKRVRTSDRQAQLGKQEHSQRILEEYLSLTDAIEARKRYNRAMARIARQEIVSEFQELMRAQE